MPKPKDTVCPVCDRFRSQHEEQEIKFPCDEPGHAIRPRNDFVIIRASRVAERGGIYVPETSIHGKEYTVVATGPKVEGLDLGDKVLMTGQEAVDWSWLPNHKGLLCIREGNVVLRFPKEEREIKEGKVVPT